MRKLLSILFSILTVFTVNGKETTEEYVVPDIPIMNEWINVDFIHIDFNDMNLKVGDKIKSR